jgi:hypothetical protein
MTLGALGVVLFLVAVESFWRPRIPYDYLTVAPVIISLLVATASTYFAAHALLEQRRTRQAGTDPVLIAHLGQRQDRGANKSPQMRVVSPEGFEPSTY